MHAQEAPLAEPVYGGRIEWMDPVALSPNQTRVFISTRSANSLFYADVNHSSAPPTITPFRTVSAVDADDGFGFDVRRFAADGASGYVYFISDRRRSLHRASPTSGTATEVVASGVIAVATHAGTLLYVQETRGRVELVQAAIDAATGIPTTTATFSLGTAALLRGEHPYGEPPALIFVHPLTEQVYVFFIGAPPMFLRSSEPLSGLSGTTTFTEVVTADLAAVGHNYFAAGIAPNGRLFAASYDGHSGAPTTHLAYTDDEHTWTTWTEPGLDAGRPANLAFTGDTTAYHVYLGRVMSTSNGETDWQHMPQNPGSSTPVMDGSIFTDPNADVIYMRTDWGVGMSADGGATVHEINRGVLAVQVNNIAMSADKHTAWVASKSGIWHVTDYNTASASWTSTPLWPQHDSRPYTSVATSVTADTVYAATGRLFRYASADGPLHGSSFAELFDADRFGFSYGTYVSAIALDPTFDGERLFISLYDPEDPSELQGRGGVYAGTFDGIDWTWIDITSAPIPSDGADINDLVVVEENGRTVIYAGAEFNIGGAGTTRGIYRLEETAPDTWTTTQDLEGTAAWIHDLYAGSDGTLYAAGSDADHKGVHVFTKARGGTWEAVATEGVDPSWAFSYAAAITANDPTGALYIAVDNELYVRPKGGTWTPYYSYPEGTIIQVLYYDDLLVGTDTGLYMHPDALFPVSGVSTENTDALPKAFALHAAYPNPFNPSTQITFTLPQAETVRLDVFNTLGQHVRALLNGAHVAQGTHQVTFDAYDLPSGTYFYRLSTPQYTATRMLLLAK